MCVCVPGKTHQHWLDMHEPAVADMGCARWDIAMVLNIYLHVTTAAARHGRDGAKTAQSAASASLLRACALLPSSARTFMQRPQRRRA